MKLKISFLMLIASIMFIAPHAKAQYVERKPVDSVITGTKILTWNSTKNGVHGFQITAVKDTGTLGGTVYWEQSIDTMPTLATRVWKTAGSYTLTNTTGPQGEIFAATPFAANAYRFRIVTTGGKVHLYACYLYR